MKAALYLRVSTDDQSVESQRADLQGEITRRGWEPVEYVDEGFCGATNERPALERMLKDVRAGRVKAVICYKLDRLGRSLTHLVQLFGEFDSRDVALIIPGQGIDTSDKNPMGKLVRGILSVIAEFQLDIIRENTRAGMRVAKSRGRLANRKPRGQSHGMEFKVARARIIVKDVPGITVAALAKDLNVSMGTAWKLKQEALKAA